MTFLTSLISLLGIQCPTGIQHHVGTRPTGHEFPAFGKLPPELIGLIASFLPLESVSSFSPTLGLSTLHLGCNTSEP